MLCALSAMASGAATYDENFMLEYGTRPSYLALVYTAVDLSAPSFSFSILELAFINRVLASRVSAVSITLSLKAAV